MSELNKETERFERALGNANQVLQDVRAQLVALAAEVNSTTAQRDAYEKRVKVLEGIVAGLILREPADLTRALQRLLVDDAPAIAEALRNLLKVAVANEHATDYAPVMW